MARPIAQPALPTSPIDVVRVAGVALVALLLATLVAWPVAAVTLQGLLARGASWPWRPAIDTLAVALTATAGALFPGTLIAFVLMRVDTPGRSAAWHMFKVGTLMPPFIISLGLLALGGPGRPFGSGPSRAGLAAIALGQALALLPLAVVLVVRALARAPVELEQAAEVLGARRTTVLRRVTLALAGPGMLHAAFLVLGLCLADVATPLLLGGDAQVLATVVVGAAAADPSGAARGALTLAALALAVAVGRGAWRSDGVAVGRRTVLPRLERPAPPALRWSLGVCVWLVAAALAGLWVAVPLTSLLARGARGFSLEHWGVLATGPGARSLGTSVVLALGAALGATALALAAGWIAARRRGTAGRAIEALGTIPLVVPGLVAGVGYALILPGPSLGPAATLPIMMALVACWELPVTVRAARAALVRSGRSAEEAAISLGAGTLATLTRVVAPALAPAAARMATHVFAAGVLAVGSIIVLAGPGLELGTLTMLTLAAAGATGAACAVATTLLGLAGGAVLLGRAIAGRLRGSTPLA